MHGNELISSYGARSRVVDHAKCDDEPALAISNAWNWLEISWLLLSAFGISHLKRQQRNSVSRQLSNTFRKPIITSYHDNAETSGLV